MGIVFWVIGILAVLIVLFVWWRLGSVERGARQRDARLLEELDPVGEKLARGEEVSAEEVAALVGRPELRRLLYAMLKHFERLELFPAEHVAAQREAEAELAYWMMHPNELQDPPEKIELVESLARELDGEEGRFFVFRYRMPPGHWAGEEWLLGVAGPYRKHHVPYSGLGAFSRSGDRYGKVEAEALVDWYVGMFVRRAG